MEENSQLRPNFYIENDVQSIESAEGSISDEDITIKNSNNGTKLKTEDIKSTNDNELNNEQECYICKVNYWTLHHFYDKLCPKCAELNWTKRNQTVDLNGRVALVTGARVKIGYETALILLRCGATVIVTSRFPHDTALRYAKEVDYLNWKDRLSIYGLDMRFLKDVEDFTKIISEQYDRLDIIINNAAQTIRRPPAYYSHLIPNELLSVDQLPPEVQPTIKLHHPALASWDVSSNNSLQPMIEDVKSDGQVAVIEMQDEKPTTAAVFSQIRTTDEDHMSEETVHALFPAGKLDEDNQQIDLRGRNSWVLEHDQVTSVELAEVHAINAMAPFIINSRLLPLMKRTKEKNKFIINVSSVEGQFYHKKTTQHPHTNCAKASLNMMTRTSSKHFANYNIWMNAVDTGWITDMNPVRRTNDIANKYQVHFRNPLDNIDGAARILDPIFTNLKIGRTPYGKFFKDYEVAPW